MKVLAARRADIDDITKLAAVLDVDTADEVLAVFDRIFVDVDLPERSRLVVEDLFGAS